MGLIRPLLMSLALAAVAAGLAYAAVTNDRERAGAQAGLQNQPREDRHLGSLPTAEMREAWFCGDGCDFDIAREFPCSCPSVDDEVTP